MTKVLVLESDFKLQIALKCFLTYKGFNTTVCSNTAEAKRLIFESDFKMIVLDIHMLDENAFSFVKYVRTKGCYAPAIFIGERSYQELMERECSGLDEFILRPFGVQALTEALSRATLKSTSTRKPLLYEDIKIDEHHNLLMVKERKVHLGKTEMKILMLLAKKAGQVVSLEKLHALLKYEGGKFNVRVFSYISALRYKLEEAGVQGLRINFVKDGYRLDIS